MKVAFLVRKFPKLSETFILNQITGLMDAGIDVDVLAWRPGRDRAVHPEVEAYDLAARTRYIQPPRSRVRRLAGAASLVVGGRLWRHPSVAIRALKVRSQGRSAGALSLLYAAGNLMRGGPHDVVHCQFGHLGPTAVMLRRVGALPGRIAVSFRGADLTVDPPLGEYAELFREADLVLPVCDAFRDRLVEMGCSPDRIRVLRSGVSLDRFAVAGRSRGADEPTRVLTIARLVEKKGVAFGIRAVEHVQRTGRRVHYTVVGDGPLRTELERLAGELGVTDVVRFTGAMDHDQVLAELGAAHVLLAPSITASTGDQEGIPNVLKEAMAMGMPVVSTYHSGIPELVEDGVSGFLAPERDVDVLANRLVSLVDHPEQWGAMGRSGRTRVEVEYDSVALNRRLVELYTEITDPSIRPARRDSVRPLE